MKWKKVSIDRKQFQMKVSMALRDENTNKAIKICHNYLDKDIEKWIIYEKLALIYLIRSEWHKSIIFSDCSFMISATPSRAAVKVP